MEPITIIHIAIFLYVLLHTIAVFANPKQLVTQINVNPLLVAAGIQAVTGIASSLKKRPDVPDVFSPAVRESIRSRDRITELLERQSGNLDAQLAARGATGSGGAANREALIRSASSSVSDIDAQLADVITNAGNRQRELEFRDQTARFNNRQQAISQIGNAATTAFTLSQLQAGGGVDSLGEVLPTGQPVINQVQPTIPQGFDITAISPSVNPLTRSISFG